MDLFLALVQKNNMTATEVSERIEEKVQAISPVVSRLQAEFLEPVVKRVVNLVVAKGVAPRPPNELLAHPGYEIQYSSRLDARFSALDTARVRQFIAEVAEFLVLLERAPQLRAYIKPDYAIDLLAANYRVDAALLQDKRRRKQLLEAMQQAREQQETLEALKDKVKPVDLQAPADPGSVLGALTEGAGQ